MWSLHHNPVELPVCYVQCTHSLFFSRMRARRPVLQAHLLSPHPLPARLPCCSTLIIACNMCNQPREATAVYRRMLEEGYSPNSTTYNALISAYGKSGQLDKVMEVFQVRPGPRAGLSFVLEDAQPAVRG